MRRLGLFAIWLMISISSCVGLSPEARKVSVTKAAEAVEGCKVLGTVRAQPPYVGPRDGMHQMQNEVAGLGGDTLFVTSYNVTATGVAYRCRSEN
jgi:hypothetical protein